MSDSSRSVAEFDRADATAVAADHAAALDRLAADLDGGTPADDGSWRPVVAGPLVRPTADDYDDARRVWNGTVDRHPAAVAYAGDARDVMRVVAAARETGLGVALRAGGHSVAGTSVADGALVLDCSRLDRVAVDPDDRTAVVGPGATWGDLDAAADEFGLATPGGVDPDTGVAGLTLGGGTGYLTRGYGLACDRLRRVDLVTADGDRVTAAADRNPDLFRALRGGGGNFGAAVELEFDLVSLPGPLAMCDTWYPFAAAGDVLREYRALTADADRETNVSPYVARVPDDPDSAFPADAAGDLAVCVLGAYAGDADRGRARLRPYRNLGSVDPLYDHAATVPYPELQSYLADEGGAGERHYWKSLAVDRLTDGLVDLVLERSRALPSDRSTVVVWPLGGAVADLSPDETAFPRRDANYVLNFEAAWSDPAADDRHVAWARESVAAVRESGGSGVLPNFPGSGTGDDAARALYLDNYGWLRDVKTDRDPENVFGPSGRLDPRPR
ncbi:FAD-binding oxidoreductase [Candidatus Halobonum tyrrellensis]|uniref:(R)-6-hydroxynicotine oxidase n=1 Tax=Candidatus Halobonum tyrrellensis G22 TaxID=1324957 RepID=V4IWI5_9EURY|nr:FAD-binding oxidoreductase [Candidatus Halobonum tyrrellensis]ESP87547.1 (R)-6-hydroxynicotine oxidase [Candidatus Halobonum tyrrellensis G22]